MKKLLTLIAACGLTVSAWAVAPDAEAADPLPIAEGGWAVVRYGWDYMGWTTDSLAYDLAMGVSQAVGAAAGGLIGSSFGPVGTVIGAGLGAA